MGLEERKLPVGIQSFDQIIRENYLLVDKTEYIYKLVHTGKPYFLSRPRRFGKSLLLSTMKAYWEGKKELFKGFKIEELEKNNPDAWQTYPVFYMDFNKANFADQGALEGIIVFDENDIRRIPPLICRDILDLIPLLYQTGYLTLKGYDAQKAAYTLGFPNKEVEYSFLESLLPVYAGNVGSGSGKDILTLTEYVEEGRLENIRKVFEALFAGIPYPLNEDPFEHDFQSVIYITLTLLGQYVHCEQHTNTGRIDCTVETDRFIYIFEFKRDDSADHALKQINDMHYVDLYAADKRKLYKIGVNFDSETRQISEWKAEER